MPCRDFMDDIRPVAVDTSLKQRCDMLSRIACKALTHIEENFGTLGALETDPEIRKWWDTHKEADRQAAEQARLAQIRNDTLASLSPDQIRALGIKL